MSQLKSRDWRLGMLYVAISFLSAGLLLVIQPMASRLLLPSFGGSAAVWNTALVFFQTGLLAGYLYAHLASRTWLGSRWAQMGLLGLPLFALPFGLPALASGSFAQEHPTVAVLVALALMVGAPYFAVSTMSPTIQRWFLQTDHPLSSNPYPLYAASNAGSLLALVAYPILIEPGLDLTEQARWFAGGYAALVLLAGIAALRLPRGELRKGGTSVKAPKGEWRESLAWVYRAFVPSLLLLGVTRHLSTDVAAFPLLWVVPLALYLGTFVVAFSGRSGRLLRPSSMALKLVVVAAVLAIGAEVGLLWLAVVLPLVALTLTGLVAHLTLYETRPPPESLTRFYLWVSAGGALGGAVGALVAPAVFDSVMEYPLGLVLSASLVVGFRSRRVPAKVFAVTGVFALAVIAVALGGGTQARFVLGAAVLVAYWWSWQPAAFAAVMLVIASVAVSFESTGREVLSVRTFYGVYEVVDEDAQHVLMSGTTMHGVQWYTGASLDGTPLAYYHPTGPVGPIMEYTLGDGGAEVGIIGLGIGSLAAYGRPGDSFIFFEIDPAVEAIARDTALFDYLARSPASTAVVIGDGRLRLEGTSDRYQLLVVDAFSSDSIPVHLLTREAVELYLSKIDADGLVAVHISNRHLDLEPVLGRISEDVGAAAAISEYWPEDEDGAAPSRWVVLSTSQAAIDEVTSRSGDWRKLSANAPLWTDSYSNVLSVIRW